MADSTRADELPSPDAGPIPDAEMSLDDWIGLLTRTCVAPPDDVDVPEVTGLLGEAFLELYERDADVGALSAAAVQFQLALELAPGHPDRHRWRHGLGRAYAERAWRDGELADHDAAIAAFTAFFDGLPHDDPDRAGAAVLGMDAHWERFVARCYRRYCPAPEVALEAERLVEAVAGFGAGRLGPEPDRYARLLTGLGHLAHHDATGDRGRLDRSIEELAPLLATAPTDIPNYVYAAGELVGAYLVRAGLDEDVHAVDLAIAVADRALAVAEPDELGWFALHHGHATACGFRWERDGDPVYLDRAARSWRAVFAAEPELRASTVFSGAELLSAHADRTGDPADLAEVVGVLGRATTGADGDWRSWYDAGRAQHLRWRLGQVPGSLDTAAHCLDRALDLGVPDDELLPVRMERAAVAESAVLHDSAQPHREAPPSVRRFAASLTELRQALAGVADPSGDLAGIAATGLAAGEVFLANFEPEGFDHARVSALLARGRTVRNAPPGWSGYLDTLDGVLAAYTDITGPGGSPDDGGLTGLARAAADQRFAESSGLRVGAILPLVMQARAIASGDLRIYGAARKMAAGSQPAASPPAPTDLPTGSPAAEANVPAGSADLLPADRDAAELALITDVIATLATAQAGNFDAAAELAGRARTTLGALPPSLHTERIVTPLVELADLITSVARGERFEVEPPPPLPVSGSLDRTALPAHLLAATSRYAVAEQYGDLDTLRRYARYLGGLVPLVDGDRRPRLATLALAGRSEFAVARRDPGDRAAARRAADWYAEALDLAGGPGHPLWSQLARERAGVLRLAGDPGGAESRRLGLSALRAHAWQVLLQAGTDHAVESARQASAAALLVAGWCLADRAYHDLVAALDAGRGLVLHAATASRTVAEWLVEAGHPELAAEWLATAGLGRDRLTGAALGPVAAGREVSDELRLRVLHALDAADAVPPAGPAGAGLPAPRAGSGTSAPGSRLLGSVSVEEVRRALTAVGADALVYLVPADGALPGTAVVLPAAGPVLPIPLPELAAGEGAPVRHLLGGRARDAVPDDAEQDGSAAYRLDRLCRWAWSAAVGQLVAHTERWQLHRPARLVLVPMGVLGQVPWHAAYEPSGGTRRYAVAELVLSYAVSARMFCASARHPIRPARSALVVGDPGGDLAFAGIEARAIREVFYPDGRFLGRPGADPADEATPANVLDWIAAAAPGPSLLHFACHGRVDPARPADAHLVLSGGTLPARDLLESSRVAELVIDQVYLAACTTNVSGQDYDEAFSLATAFLAAGAHTVFGSLWPVPDAETSLLMYLVHHFRNRESLPPVDALHRAQAWMLDPARRPPDGMPPELARHCTRPGLADPLAWAAFTHLGR